MKRIIMHGIYLIESKLKLIDDIKVLKAIT